VGEAEEGVGGTEGGGDEGEEGVKRREEERVIKVVLRYLEYPSICQPSTMLPLVS
jgi:hypothetical protein